MLHRQHRYYFAYSWQATDVLIHPGCRYFIFHLIGKKKKELPRQTDLITKTQDLSLNYEMSQSSRTEGWATNATMGQGWVGQISGSSLRHHVSETSIRRGPSFHLVKLKVVVNSYIYPVKSLASGDTVGKKNIYAPT